MTGYRPVDLRTAVGDRVVDAIVAHAFGKMRDDRQWVGWRYETRPGSAKPTKVPINPRTGGFASVSDPESWGTYEEATACARAHGLPGVGFVLTESDDLTGIDLDDCVREDSTIEPWAAEVVKLAETYTELSPSGRGLRMLARGKVEATIACKPLNIEIYRDRRYLTITGNHVRGTPTSIGPAPVTLEALYARLRPWREEKAIASPSPAVASAVEASGVPSATAFGRRHPSDYFRNVNTAALQDIGRWVLKIFPGAKRLASGVWRVSSRALGRDLEEDLSISPWGIVDFGIHDMGDEHRGKRSPIDLVREHVSGMSHVRDAAQWLCDRLGVLPSELGWIERRGDAFGEQIAEAVLRARAGLIARLPTIASSGSMDEAASIWMAAAEPGGSTVERYLASRGLAVPCDVRWVEDCAFGDTHSGAMVALITNVTSGAPQGIHLTALTQDGRLNDIASEPRRSLGTAKGGVVRLRADEDVTLALGIAEGIETALSINRFADYVRLPVWATLDTAGLASFPVLAGVETLVIAVDHHVAGVFAAIDLRDEWTAADREVFTILPRRGNNLDHVVQEFDRAA